MTWLGLSSRGALALGAVAVAGCFGSGSRPPKVTEPAPPVVVDLTTHYQRIDGFGASSAWTGGNLTDAMADLFFSPDTGIGLSLLRVQIKPDGTTAELATAKKAAARGVKVWGAPWTPPVEWKTGADSCGYAGSLQDGYRQDWANRLAGFASSMSAQGIPLVAISAQNEPNYAAVAKNGDCSTGWDSCLYAPAQLVTFVRDFLGPAISAQGLSTPIMAPESQDWTSFDSYAAAFAGDAGVMQYLGMFAAHNYGGSPHTLDAVQATGMPVWETEVSDSKTADAGMDSAMTYAQMIHNNLVNAGVSAWHFWWLVSRGGGNSALSDGMALNMRGWTLGNWSRFVRPGYLRVAATPISQDRLLTTAFVDAAGGRLVIVAANQAQYDLDQDFTITGGAASDVTPWVTSATQKLQAQAAVPVVDGTFSVTLPARTVTTFVAPLTP